MDLGDKSFAQVARMECACVMTGEHSLTSRLAFPAAQREYSAKHSSRCIVARGELEFPTCRRSNIDHREDARDVTTSPG